ncbi:MAG: sigma-54 dependent transcriptional regulator [Spirochaetes bacterium]|nr:sigma-54 dependent transcriptional regulator [Spirochaetota bacterium]
MSTFLIIDRDDNRCADIGNFFRSLGHSLYEASDWAGAVSELARREYDVVVSSVAIVGGSIHELIRAVKGKNPDTAIIVHADLDTTQEGLKAVQEGAFSIVQNPFSIPELSFQIKRALERRGQKGAPSVAPGISHEVYQPYNFIGESEEIRKVFRIVNRVAKTDSSVIITGETGTGKELVAGAIHYNSSRAGGHFVRVNCAALPEQLLESELFGHEKGSFTGADRMRIGRFEHANGGTIFLDEVADMSLFTQGKVLRVIQEKEFERLGSNETVKTDVRIISATNRSLMDLMSRGLFREDLYYRLNVVTIRLPPLRERNGDIALLIQFFLKKYSAEMSKKIRGIEPGAMKVLTSYHWPGNIRELENTLERAVLMAEGDSITTEDLNLFFAGEGPEIRDDGIRLPAKGIRLEDAERELIEQALERTKWVQKDAARLLGVSSRALNYKIKNFGITHHSWKQNR